MSAFTPLDKFESECAFPLKSSRVPCKGTSSSGSGEIDPGDINFGLMGQVSGWVRPSSGKFPQMTILNSATVMVPGGTGYIVNPTNGIREVTWAAQDIIISKLTRAWITTIGIDESGAVVQLNGNISPEWARNHIILGVVTHINGYVDAVHMTPAIWGGVPYAAYDLAMVNRNSIMEGGLVTPSIMGSMSLDIQPRKMFFYGGAMNTPMDQNTIQQDSQKKIMFFPVLGDSTSYPLVTDLPVTQYNPDGGSTLVTVPGTGDESTAFRLYQLGNRYLLMYGQHYYSTLAECVTNAPSEQLVLPDKMQSATLLATICVRRDATDLSDPDDSVIIVDPSIDSGAGEDSDYRGLALYFPFVGDGEETDFFFPGADADNAAWYDTYLEKVADGRDFKGQEPTVDYTVELDVDEELGAGAWIRFTTAPGDGVHGFAVLRGNQASNLLFALMNSEEFMTMLQTLITNTMVDSEHVLELGALRYLIPLYDVEETTFLVDGTKESYLLRCKNAEPTVLSIRLNVEPEPVEEGEEEPPDLNWEENAVAAPYFSVKQETAAQVDIVGETEEVIIKVPAGYLPRTRAQQSIITATCDYAAGNEWTLSGDLAVDPNYVDGQARERFNKVLAEAFVNSTTSVTTPDGFVANVAEGRTYRIRAFGTYQTAATTTGATLGILGADDVAGTLSGKASGALASGAAATDLAATLYALTGTGSSITTTGVSAATTPHWIELDAILVCTASGTVALTFASEVAASAAQLNAGFLFSVEEIAITVEEEEEAP